MDQPYEVTYSWWASLYDVYRSWGWMACDSHTRNTTTLNIIQRPDIIESSGALASTGRRSLSQRAEAHARVVTTMTLLCVSFYVIASTLPATLVYLIRSNQGDQSLTDEQIDLDPTWILYFRLDLKLLLS